VHGGTDRYLAHKKSRPQAIRVDVELNQGLKVLQPGDHIAQVLDLCQARQILLDDSTAGHVHLLESLVRQFAKRLGWQPIISGVRLKVAKLHIFEDSEAAIALETGVWDTCLGP